MDSWLLWLIVASAFTIGELHTNAFYLAPFAVGAFVAAILAGAGAGGLIPLMAFGAAGAVFLSFLRPFVMHHRHSRPTLRTGVAALIGQNAVVVTRVSNHEGVGTVRIGGEVWSARSFDDDQILEAGQVVDVAEIKGATAIVMSWRS